MWVVDLRWSAGLSFRISSQMHGCWYFPMLLLRDGSLTWMNMASLIVLLMPCASLPIWWNSPHWWYVPWPGCVGWWGRGFWVFFALILNSPSQLSNILLLTIHLGVFEPVNYPLFCIVESLSLGATNRLQIVFLALKWTCMPRLLQVLLNLLLRPLE